MTAAARKRARGNAMVEFTLVGIPIIFLLISIFEMSRGMWLYNTLAYAVKDTARFAAVHGQLCVNSSVNCQLTVAQLATHLRDAGVGLLPDQLNVTFASAGRTVPCSPLATCLSDASCFPTAADCSQTMTWAAMPGMPVTITARYPFANAISMFWPGGGDGIVFGTFNLPARSREAVMF